MAVLVTLDYPAMTEEQFRSVVHQAGTVRQLVPGLYLRAAGPVLGGWRVVACFESQGVFETYLRERLQPGFDKLGIRPTRTEIWPLAEMQTSF
jgi:hypothetical protein